MRNERENQPHGMSLQRHALTPSVPGHGEVLRRGEKTEQNHHL
jgi:hypothetical protein